MNEFKFSSHALKQMAERNISVDDVLKTVSNPLQQCEENEGQRIYQRIFTFDNKQYLIRIFVNEEVIPKYIKTVYKTSKIKKYLL